MIYSFTRFLHEGYNYMFKHLPLYCLSTRSILYVTLNYCVEDMIGGIHH